MACLVQAIGHEHKGVGLEFGAETLEVDVYEQQPWTKSSADINVLVPTNFHLPPSVCIRWTCGSAYL